MEHKAAVYGETGPVILPSGRAVSPQFPYLQVLLLGRPRHDRDEFSFRHPQMERGKRAKLFAPFDALDGFGDSIESKNIRYVAPVDLGEEEKAELNRRLVILRRLVPNGRAARKRRIQVTARYFAPHGEGGMGQYVSCQGAVRRVSAEKQTLTVGDTVIPFDKLLSLTAQEEALFAPENEP